MMDIFNLLHRKNEPIKIVNYKREFIEGIAAEQGRTFDSLGETLYLMAGWLSLQGNRGMSPRFFDDTLSKDALATSAHSPAWDGILWQNDEGLWFARKKPHWSLVWGERYGWDSTIGQQLLAHHHEEAQTDHAEVLAWLESRKPKRKVDTLAGQPAEEIETRQVAYVAAVAQVLYRRYTERGFSWSGSAGVLRWHYKTLHRDATAELEYRTQSDPKERSSKKKTKSAIEDWAKARAFLETGTHHFFSEAFIKQAVQSDGEPDLDVDYEHLPKQPADQTPVRWLTDGDLVRQFMTWVDAGSDPASFEYEDKQAILRQLRAMFARAKGQQTGEEITVRGQEDVE